MALYRNKRTGVVWDVTGAALERAAKDAANYEPVIAAAPADVQEPEPADEAEAPRTRARPRREG